MGRSYREFLEEKLQDPEFKKEWDDLETEFQSIQLNLSDLEVERLINSESTE